MNLLNRTIVLLLLLPAHWALAAISETKPLGTLFYTPTERAAITGARDGKDTQEAPSGITLSGVIKRARGKGTLWINNKPIAEGQAIPPTTTPQLTAQGVTIDGKPVRVGETINLITGEKSDLLPSSAVNSGNKP